MRKLIKPDSSGKPEAGSSFIDLYRPSLLLKLSNPLLLFEITAILKQPLFSVFADALSLKSS